MLANHYNYKMIKKKPPIDIPYYRAWKLSNQIEDYTLYILQMLRDERGLERGLQPMPGVSQ